jgi:uncharacterized SAM-binding protein YcdF (DUF218 family)
MIFTAMKVLQSLLLPPGVLLVAIAVAVLLAVRGKRRAALALATAACGLIFALSLQPVSNMLLRPLETRYAPLPFSTAASVKADVIVLLGGGTTPEAGGQAVLSQASTRRALHAALLQRRLGLPLITTGGRVAPDPQREPEAAVAARLMETLGVPSGMIREESESRTTWENAVRVRDRFRPRRVVLVTSAIHMPRAVACFRRLGIETVPAPTDYLAEEVRVLLDWLPSGTSLADSLSAIREYVGIAAYWALYGARPPSRAELATPEAPRN